MTTTTRTAAVAHNRIQHILPHLCGGNPIASKNVSVGSALKDKFQKEGGMCLLLFYQYCH